MGSGWKVIAIALWLITPVAGAADLIEFWDQPQYGANSFNKAPPDQAYFEALRKTGATWVRLTFSKWPGEGRDFLLGDADHYVQLPATDLATLKSVLDDAHAAGVRVVLAPLSLPGSRWIQQNDGTFDDRLWTERRFWDQSAAFWSDVARELRDHPAVAAYNLVNEPAPERTQTLVENASLADHKAFIEAHAGTARDLTGFYQQVVTAIRRVDPLTPIMLDGGYYANPRALAAWPGPFEDSRILYAFHMYEPWVATSAANLRRAAPLRYPGAETDYDGQTIAWDKGAVAAHIGIAFEWADKHQVPPSRIVAAEFGCMRRWQDCGSYLTDVIDAVDARNGHWAFYAFREDEWDGMDYELPSEMPPGRFYWLSEEGRTDEIPRNGELMELIRGRMDKSKGH